MALLLTGCVNDDDAPVWAVAVGERVPPFSVTLNDGSVIWHHDLEGKTAVIVFFNTSCGDCRRELPEIQCAYEEAGDDTVYLCIAREETEPSIARFWRENGLTMPYSPQADRRIYNLFATAGIPRLYVISPFGIITAAYCYDSNWNDF